MNNFKRDAKILNLPDIFTDQNETTNLEKFNKLYGK